MKIRLEGRKKKICLLAAGAVALLFVGGTVVKGLRGMKVETTAASLQTVEDRYTEEGIITSGGEFRLVSEVPGPVKEVLVRENDMVKEGDLMEISVPGLTAERVKVPVKSVIEESLGSGCYLSTKAFYRFFNSDPMAGTVLLKVESGKMEEVREQLLKTSRVTWMVDTDRIRSGYQDMMGSMMAMIQMFAFMSVAAGGILIYNISMINIRERITELGTLVIMGGTDREIGRILLFEQAVYFVLGIFTGILGSRGVKYLIEHLVVSDAYTIDLAISSSSYLTAFLTCLGMAGVSLLAQTRFVKKIRLTDILKERE